MRRKQLLLFFKICKMCWRRSKYDALLLVKTLGLHATTLGSYLLHDLGKFLVGVPGARRFSL